MVGAFKVLKHTEWAALVPEKTEKSGSTRTEPDTVKPTVKKLSTDDPSTIILQFPAGSLARGWCHRLTLGGQGGLGTPDFDTALLADDLVLCASKCLCDLKGTATCDEDSSVCHCHAPYAGADCS
jgi:hypothetical protein